MIPDQRTTHLSRVSESDAKAQLDLLNNEGWSALHFIATAANSPPEHQRQMQSTSLFAPTVAPHSFTLGGTSGSTITNNVPQQEKGKFREKLIQQILALNPKLLNMVTKDKETALLLSLMVERKSKIPSPKPETHYSPSLFGSSPPNIFAANTAVALPVVTQPNVDTSTSKNELSLQFLEQQADPTLSDSTGWSPLHAACAVPSVSLVVKILQAGAKIGKHNEL